MAGINLDATYVYQGLDANELVLHEATALPAIRDVFGVVEGVKGKQAIHTIQHEEKYTKRDAGCGQGASPISLQSRLKTWEPEDLKIWKTDCWTTSRGKIVEWKLKTLNEKSDLTNTNIEDYYIAVMQRAAHADLRRLAYFGDMTITGSRLTLGNADVENYNGFNGLWKRGFDAVQAGKMVRVPIAQNSVAGTQVIADEAVFPLFQDIFDAGTAELNDTPINELQFRVTRSLFRGYLRYREGQKLDTSFNIMADGVTSLDFRGVPIAIEEEWSKRINADFKIGGKLDLPHRAILTTKGNMQLAFDALPINKPSENPFEIWYEKKDEEWNARLKYVADSQFADDKKVVLAY